MVSRAYLDKKPSSGPNQAKLFLDQTALPALIDTAGTAEVALDRLGTAARAAPIPMFVLFLLTGALLARLTTSPRK
jgi:hypothetical protein